MEKIKLILVLTFSLFFISLGYTQSYYQVSGILEGTDRATGKSFKLVCENNFGQVRLYNFNNSYVRVPWERKDGQPISEEIAFGYVNTFESNDDGTFQQARDIFLNRLTRNKLDFVGYNFRTILYINSSTGKVTDVEFIFLDSSPFANWSPGTYYEIMEDYKNNMPAFKVSSTGRLMNYVLRSWVEEW